MQEEEVGKNIILSIKDDNYKKIVTTSNGKYVIYNLIFDSDKFLPSKQIYEEDETELIKKAKVSKMLDYCIKLLRKKFFSESELKEKLLKKFNDAKLTDITISLLTKNKVLDDRKYVALAMSLLDESLYGKYYIIDFFKKKNISDEIINSLVFDKEKEKANRFFLSVKNLYVSSNSLKAKKKIGKELLSRGFELPIISSLVDSLKIDHDVEQKLLMIDANKLRSKFSKNYSGFNLNNKIITGLIKIGYSYNDIINYLKLEDNSNDKGFNN